MPGITPSPKTALVLVDLQHWIVEMALAPISGRAVADAAARLRDGFAAAGAPVVLVRYLRSDGGDGGAAAAPNQFVPQVAARADEHTVTKSGLDAFEGTDLDRHLRTLGVDTVVLAGISTAHGVGATAATAVRSGYVVAVVADATASVSDQEHTYALDRVAAAGAKVCAVADLV